MTIRHLQILVVYVAVAMAALVPILRLEMLPLPLRLTVAGLILPPVMLFTTMVCMRRGPLKDWAYQVLTNIAMVGLTLALGGGLVVTITASPSAANNSSVAIIGGVLIAVLIAIEAIHYAPRMFPRICPVCRQPAVLPDRRGRSKYSHLCLWCKATLLRENRRFKRVEVETDSAFEDDRGLPASRRLIDDEFFPARMTRGSAPGFRLNARLGARLKRASPDHFMAYEDRRPKKRPV